MWKSEPLWPFDTASLKSNKSLTPLFVNNLMSKVPQRTGGMRINFSNKDLVFSGNAQLPEESRERDGRAIWIDGC